MKTIVIYRSTTGFTRKYAEWIAKALNADLFEHKQVKDMMLQEYDAIVFGGSLHAVGIRGLKLIKRNLPEIAGKKIVVFATGAAPMQENVEEEVKNGNFNKEELEHIKVFYLRGGFNYKKLGFIDKLLMTLLKWKMKSKNKADLTADEIGMLAVYETPVDYTKEKYIEPIVQYLQEHRI